MALARLSEINVSTEGVSGAKDFFEAKVRCLALSQVSHVESVCPFDLKTAVLSRATEDFLNLPYFPFDPLKLSDTSFYALLWK